jgi:hypothetical protein
MYASKKVSIHVRISHDFVTFADISYDLYTLIHHISYMSPSITYIIILSDWLFRAF